jgi:hypothetical protein
MPKHFEVDEETTKLIGKKVFIRVRIGESRRRYTNAKSKKNIKNGSRITLATYLWRKHHPDNPIRRDENIHHIDFDRMNDTIENLQKMKKKDHDKLHREHDRAKIIGRI